MFIKKKITEDQHNLQVTLLRGGFKPFTAFFLTCVKHPEKHNLDSI